MDIFYVHLPIAGIEFNVLLLFAIGFFVGILGGFFGVGGGWIVTPALNIFGFHMAYAIGTDLAQIFGTSIVGTKKHSKLGNVDWKLGIISIIGSVIGVEIGAQTVMFLEKLGEAGPVIRYVYMCFLLGLCSFMFYDYFVLRKRVPKNNKSSEQTNEVPDDAREEVSPIAKKLYSLKIPPMISFKTSGIESVSLWVVTFIFLLTGFLSGFLGVGGGFIRMPCLVYLIGCPTVIAVGTDLMSVVFTGGYGCLTYAFKGRVDIVAAFFMFIGAVIGVQFGVAAIKYIRGYKIRILFAIMILLAGVSVIMEQIYRTTKIKILDSLSAYFVIGAAGLLCAYLLIRLAYLYSKTKNKFT